MIDTQVLIRILKAVPEKRLRLIELAGEVVGEDGQVDPVKAGFLEQEISQACEEAEAYSQATRRVVWHLKSLR